MQPNSNVRKRPATKGVWLILRRGRQTLARYMNGNMNPASRRARLDSFHDWVGSEVSRSATFS